MHFYFLCISYNVIDFTKREGAECEKTLRIKFILILGRRDI